jgi:hypothetical protein
MRTPPFPAPCPPAADGAHTHTRTHTGRCTNLFLCGQSAAGVTFADVAFKGAAGFILLASTIDGRYSQGKLPSLEDFGR